MKPQKLPQANREYIKELLEKNHPGIELPDFLIVGIRGYYKKTMGDPTKNDRAIYDDAIFIVSKDEFHTFNANTDPSAFKTGIAKLKPGVWPCYRFDIHGGRHAKYPAICQRAGEVTVSRDNREDETGMFGINIHKGGYKTTSSEGCQTIYPDQWDRFYLTAARIFKGIHGEKWKNVTVTYILIEV